MPRHTFHPGTEESLHADQVETSSASHAETSAKLTDRATATIIELHQQLSVLLLMLLLNHHRVYSVSQAFMTSLFHAMEEPMSFLLIPTFRYALKLEMT